jgi:hypothetical protein
LKRVESSQFVLVRRVERVEEARSFNPQPALQPSAHERGERPRSARVRLTAVGVTPLTLAAALLNRATRCASASAVAPSSVRSASALKFVREKAVDRA